MIMCKVIGNVWATKKEESLNGLKLMIVQQMGANSDIEGIPFVAGDVVGAGIGEEVLVVSGSTARKAFGVKEISVDAAIVGIIDSIDVEKKLYKEGASL